MRVGGEEGEASRTRRKRRMAAIAVILAVLMPLSTEALAARVRVRATDRDTWRPRHLYITIGDRVVWTNPDSRVHNVVAYGGGWRFDRRLEPGDRAARVFDEILPGGDPYTYRCTLHSAIADGRCEGMCGSIHVFTD